MRAAIFAVLLLAPCEAAAQAPNRLVPLVGLGLGATRLPEPLVETCGGNPRTQPTAELMGGVARGKWRAEARTAAITQGVVMDCLTLGIRHESGTHTDQVYPYSRENGELSVSAHVQYAPVRFISAGIGAGSLRWSGTPFLLASAALRSRGRIAFVVEMQARTTRLRYNIETAEWTNHERTRVIARQEHHEWHRDFATRFGVELRLRKD